MTVEVADDLRQERAVQPPRWRAIRRAGCGVALIVWFLLLLTPCLLLVLAVQGDLRIATGSAPGQELRVWLIMEAETRGVGISNGVVRAVTEGGLCVETQITYALWAGSEDGSVYCECYGRSNESEEWSSVSSLGGDCPE